MSHNENTVLDACDIRKDYPSGQGQLRVLNGVNLQVRRGELVAIMGASGGKSTLLHILGMLEEPTSGQLVMYLQMLPPSDSSLYSLSQSPYRLCLSAPSFAARVYRPKNAMMPAIARQGDAMRGANRLAARGGLRETDGSSSRRAVRRRMSARSYGPSLDHAA